MPAEVFSRPGRTVMALGSGSDKLALMSSQAVVGILGAYGLRLTEAGRAAPGEQSLVVLAKKAGLEAPTVGAFVTFAGPKLRGGLLLASTVDLVASTRPTAGRNSSPPESASYAIMIRDWISELANQVLGRLKNGLMAASVSFDTHPPIPLSAQAIGLALPKSPATRPILFRAGRAGVSFWLDVLWNEEVDLSKADEGTSTNGKLVLF